MYKLSFRTPSATKAETKRSEPCGSRLETAVASKKTSLARCSFGLEVASVSRAQIGHCKRRHFSHNATQVCAQTGRPNWIFFDWLDTGGVSTCHSFAAHKSGLSLCTSLLSRITQTSQPMALVDSPTSQFRSYLNGKCIKMPAFDVWPSRTAPLVHWSEASLQDGHGTCLA